MSWGTVTCLLDASTETVARTMSAHRIHAVVILGTPNADDVERPLWGIVSDIDLMKAAGRPPSAGVTEIMQRPAATVTPEDSLPDAARTMAEHRVSHLVVLDRPDGHPVGIISALDIAGVLTSS